MSVSIRDRSARSAFTLVELLVVIAIIAVLIGLLLPAIQEVREASRRASCQNNLKQIGLALHNYHDVNNSFPPGSIAGGSPYGNQSGHNWRLSIFPFLEQGSVYSLLNLGGYYNVSALSFFVSTQYGPGSGPNAVLLGLFVKTYRCPSDTNDPFGNVAGSNDNDPAEQLCDYVGISGSYPDPAGRTTVCYPSMRGQICNTGVFPLNESTRLTDITDGTSNTLMVGEQSGQVNLQDIRSNYGGGWTGVSMTQTVSQMLMSAPGQNYYGTGQTTIVYNINTPTATSGSSSQPYENNTILDSMHPGGINVLMGDGSVRFLFNSISISTLLILGSKNDGLAVPSDF